MDNLVMENNNNNNNFNHPYSNNNNLNDSFLSRRGNDVMSMHNNIRQDQFLNNNMNNNNNNIQYQNNQIPYKPQNDNMIFNQNMNNLVRNTLKSRGVTLTEGKNSNSPFNNKNFDINGTNVQDNDRKKMLLNNIQQQMHLTKNHKLMDLEKKRKDDEKYLKEMENFYPFGRGGAGAPIRDKFGNVQTSRKALISDPKYQHYSINVDDDFEEVGKNSKQYGLANFINKNNQLMNQFQPVPLQYNNMGNMSSMSSLGNFNQNNQNNQNSQNNQNNQNNQRLQSVSYNNNIPNYNNNWNQNMMPNQNNNMPMIDENNYYSNNMINNAHNQNQMNQGYNYKPQPDNTFNQMNNMGPMNNMNPGNDTQQPQYNNNTNNANNIGVSVSYKNTEVDDDHKRKEKLDYGSYLRNQMDIDKKKKEIEKEQKKKEEWEEEMRIKRQMEILKQQEESENEKKKMDMDRLQNENQAIRDQYVISKKKKVNIEEEYSGNMVKNNVNNVYNGNNYQNENQNQYQNNNSNFIQNENENKINSIINNDPNLLNYASNQEDVELRQNINNEIVKLRSNIVDQQNVLLKQINDLKTETQNANMQRYEVLKEFSVLKEEISKQRVDEEMRRKYVYDVLVDNNTKVTNVYANSRLPELNQNDYKMEFPKPKNHQKNLKSMYYDDTIKHPNRVQLVPNLNEYNDKEIKTSSKFIDVDSHNIIDSLNIYQPSRRDEELEKIKSRGYELDEDFGALRSFYKDKEKGGKKEHTDNKYFYEQKNKYENIGEDELDQNLHATGSKWNSKINISSNKRNKTPVRSTYIDDNINKEKKSKFSNFVDDNIEFNKQVLDDDTLSINQIYNKNLDRLRYLNNLEDGMMNNKENNKLEDIINCFGTGNNGVKKIKENNFENFQDKFDDNFLYKLENNKNIYEY